MRHEKHASLLVLLLAAACSNRSSAPVAAGPTPTPTATLTATPTPVSTTPVPTPTATLTATPTATPTPPVPVDADWKLTGRVVLPGGVLDAGEVAIKGDTIVCADVSCPTINPAAPVYAAGGTIYPGLVDLHNHVAYDFLPPWTPPAYYDHHSQWQSTDEYKAAKQPYTDWSATYSCEMTKYAEVSELSAGVTTTEGAPQRLCIDTLIRDVDNYNDLGLDRVRTNVLGIGTVSTAEAMSLIAQMDSGVTQSYVIHLAEGIDEVSRAEWDKLESLGLVRKETVIIHGTALGDAEFKKMAAAGMNLVWSPVSNVVLYGATTDVITAKADGVKISLAPDWTLTGSPEMLDELHFAALLSDWNGGIFTDRELLQMATENPADASSYGGMLGRIAPGSKADLMVVKNWDTTDAYTALVRYAWRADISLVVVGGTPLYGTPDLMTDFATPLTESVDVCGEERWLTVARPDPANLYDQSWSTVAQTILAIDPGSIDPFACYAPL